MIDGSNPKSGAVPDFLRDRMSQARPFRGPTIGMIPMPAELEMSPYDELIMELRLRGLVNDGTLVQDLAQIVEDACPCEEHVRKCDDIRCWARGHMPEWVTSRAEPRPKFARQALRVLR